MSLCNTDATVPSVVDSVRHDPGLLPLNPLNDSPIESGGGLPPFGFVPHDPMSLSYNDAFTTLDQRNEFGQPADFGDTEGS